MPQINQIYTCILQCFGLFSIFLPDQVGIQYDLKEANEITLKAVETVAGDKFSWMDLPGLRFTVHYGCLFLQMGTALFLGATNICKCGGLINFIAGTLWITCRLVVTGFWVPLLYRILSITSRTEDIMKWQRYGYFLGTNLIIHVYFLFVVRYYTMEAWDMWTYRPRTPDFRHPLRRHIPPSGKLIDRKFKYHKRPAKKENLTEWRQRKLLHDSVTPEYRDRVAWDLEGGVPMWHLGNEFTIRGEDYSGFDPMRHYVEYERIADTGVFDWDEEDFLDDEKMDKVRDVIINPQLGASNAFRDVNTTNYDNTANNSEASRKVGKVPVLAGYYSGLITGLKGHAGHHKKKHAHHTFMEKIVDAATHTKKETPKNIKGPPEPKSGGKTENPQNKGAPPPPPPENKNTLK
ncbi:uncharacterized protein LOC118436537 [Folsomia candida]|uniref:uncharacterized protein LOC118436537 n=1 Tax=Folsomia candida TaxID=158441 RepID=UPI0016054386|nr:uncharacterized protein LOC118436537 [Folsomia candida]